MSEQPIIAFPDACAFEAWLELHHDAHPGIWMRLYKKATGRTTVTYAEALEVALCFGWIDGQKRRGDEESWLQKFTRRGPRSTWSQVNIGHIERLIRERRMRPAGLAVAAAAKADGRWERAYHSSRTAELPEDFLQAVAKNRKAAAFFKTLNKAGRYAIYHRLHTAKRPETRARRLRNFVEMLARGESLHW